MQPPRDDQESRAQALLLAGQIADTIALYQEVLRREPGRLDIDARLGRLALLENDPSRAIRHLASALNKGLRTRANWEALAGAYLANGELGSAALCFERSGRIALAGALAVLSSREPYRRKSAVDCIKLQWASAVPLPVVPAEVNGTAINLLVDTAASDLVLDERVAIAAAVPLGGSEQRYFAGEIPATVTYGHVRQLQLGEVAISDILTQILDLRASLMAYYPAAPIHGILGISLLSRVTTVFDFGKRLLTLYLGATGAGSAMSASHADGNRFWLVDNQFIAVRAQTSDKNESMWMIDTGMAGAEFAISTNSASAAGAEIADRGQEQGVGGAGSVAGLRAMLPRLRVAGLDRRNVSGIALETFPLENRFGFRTSGLLACDYFRDAALTLDFSSMLFSARAGGDSIQP